MFSKKEFIEAKNRVNPFIHETGMMYSQSLSESYGNNLFFKPECLQKTGSFKIRGAANKVTLSIKDTKGLVTASSGNHGQAVAYMAKAYNLKAKIVVPNTAPQAKITAIKAYGAEIVLVGPKSSERLAVAQGISQEMGYNYIPPYDDYDVIKGQGTIGMELLDWKQTIHKIFVPVGGGGLLAGIASCIKAFNPKIKVIGVEPKNSSCMYTSNKARVRTEIIPDTIADGLRTLIPGELTFPLVQQYVDDLILVDEDEIKRAMEMVMQRMKFIIEPSGAVSVAGMLKDEGKDLNLVSVISGGNLDIRMISDLLG